MTIGEKLQTKRKELALTQDEVAKQLHVSRQAISNWELGKNYPDLETIILISDVYHISLDTLLKGDQLIVTEMKKKMNLGLIKKGVLCLILLSLAICLLVDFSINFQLTWSLLVAISLIGSSFLLGSLLIPTKQRLITLGVTFTLLIFPYLYLVQQLLIYLNYSHVQWFWKIALPVVSLWLIIFWFVGLVQLSLKWHWAYSLALIAFISIGGNYLSNWIVEGSEPSTWLFLFNRLGSIAVCSGFILLGNHLSKRKKQTKYS